MKRLPSASAIFRLLASILFAAAIVAFEPNRIDEIPPGADKLRSGVGSADKGLSHTVPSGPNVAYSLVASSPKAVFGSAVVRFPPKVINEADAPIMYVVLTLYHLRKLVAVVVSGFRMKRRKDVLG